MITLFARRRPASAASRIGGAVLSALLSTPAAGAQTPSSLACPDVGVRILATDSTGPSVVRDLRSPVDTTYTISVDHRRWTWRRHIAGVAAGMHGTEPASWHACVGAWMSVDQATAVVENARGRVRVRTSLAPLLEVLRRHQPVPRENPRREN